jgi:hypothetical protein
MSGIETVDMRPHTLDQGQLTIDFESREEPSKSPLSTRSTLRARRAQYNANRIRRTTL